MKRVFLFLAVNFLVLLTVSFFVNVLGLQPYMRQNGIQYEGLLVFCALFGFTGAIISLLISRWMAKLSMGVHLLDPERPGGAAEELLVSTVRDLCRQSGIRTLPWIGIYQSPEVNAFATGPTKNRALVAVSTGLLETMDRKGLEGVLGHEISHVANGDMVTMTLIQGVVNTFVMFFARVGAMIIDNALRSRDDEGRGGGLGYFGYIILVNVLEMVLMLFAMPLVSAFSRWREYRADHGSATLLGAPTMIHALELLGGSRRPVDNSNAAVAAFKIHGGTPGLMARLFSSHPPIEARIARLKAGL